MDPLTLFFVGRPSVPVRSFEHAGWRSSRCLRVWIEIVLGTAYPVKRSPNLVKVTDPGVVPKQGEVCLYLESNAELLMVFVILLELQCVC